jgi:hypothetical protein
MRHLAFPLTLFACIAMGTAVSAASPDPFKGAWQSIDNDGSDQTLSFGGGGDTRRVRLFDDGASACGWPDLNVSANLSGTGVIDGVELTVDLSGRCSPGGDPIGAEVTFEAVGATLVDSFGVIWHRPPGP